MALMYRVPIVHIVGVVNKPMIVHGDVCLGLELRLGFAFRVNSNRSP